LTGLYLHIPFCKQSCHYCNFHFSTSQNNREEVLTAINKEINQKALGFNDKISTIYFGGGTPTVLTEKELNTIIENIHSVEVHNWQHMMNGPALIDITFSVNTAFLNEMMNQYFQD